MTEIGAEHPADVVLRRALRDEAYALPVRLEAATVLARAAAEDRRTRTRRLGFVAGLAAVLTAVAVVALRPELLRAPTRPGASIATANPAAPCLESEAVRHGSWWVEVGGPKAFFNVEPGTRRATNTGERWLLIVRFDPAPASGAAFSVGAAEVGGTLLQLGSFNSPLEPDNIFHLDDPAPDLPGAWYLFELDVPRAGCWQLVATIGDEPVGRAVVLVDAPRPGQVNTGPTPRIAPGGSFDASASPR